MAGKLQDRVALVTGGTSGMALATAQLFAQEGASVLVTGRDQGRLDTAVAAIGPGTLGVQGDASDPDDVARLMTEVRERHGRLDVLFCSVGRWSSEPLGQVQQDEYRKTFDETVWGTLLTVQEALPLLSDGAAVVLNASTATSRAIPGGTVYSASKAAVRSFARTWAAELAPRRIRVNVVSPGTIGTAAYADVPDSYLEERRKAIPRGEIGRPEEVATAVLFLACDDSSFVTGSELFVDGGITQV